MTAKQSIVEHRWVRPMPLVVVLAGVVAAVLITLPSWLCGVFLLFGLYAMVALLVNRTTIILGPDSLVVRHHPIPIERGTRVEREQIVAVVAEQMSGTPFTRLHVVGLQLRGGQTRTLVTGLVGIPSDQAHRIVGRVQEWLSEPR